MNSRSPISAAIFMSGNAARSRSRSSVRSDVCEFPAVGSSIHSSGMPMPFHVTGIIRMLIVVLPKSQFVRSIAKTRSWLSKYLEFARHNLETIYFGDEAQVRIGAMTETEKAQLVKILSASHKQACKMIEQAEDVRRFFSKLVVSTLNNWAKQELSGVSLHLRYEDTGF